MCLIAFAWRQHPALPLVVVANRDEFFARPTQSAHWWGENPDLLAGRDLQAGGTWLGLTRDGRFAALTNFRDPARMDPGARSRGHLVVEALQTADPLGWSAELAARVDEYNPFNLLFSAQGELFALQSEGGAPGPVAAGVHALSNHLLDTPWPKVTAARERLAQALGDTLDPPALVELLHDERPAPDAALPQTGVPQEWERLLSSCFIRAPGYGTRSTSVVLMGHDGRCRFVEQTWDADGAPAGRVDQAFSITA